jgi:hypothetical protein
LPHPRVYAIGSNEPLMKLRYILSFEAYLMPNCFFLGLEVS